MPQYSDILQQLQALPPITLDEMAGIKLMNRTDTKFLTNKAQLMQVLALAKDDYYVQRINGKAIAQYRTIYWDSPDYRFYHMHQAGHRPRTKVRVRTYEDSGGLTFLEVKKKDNHGKTKKKRIQIAGQEAVFDNGGDEFVIKHTGCSLHEFHPCLQNHFHRITLVNRGKTERLTIDFDVKFHNYETDEDSDVGNLVVVELKRDGNVFSPVLALLRQLRIKPCGFSKYCIGTVMTNRRIKQNNFKQKMINYRKISKAQ